MKVKPIVPRSEANRDVDEAIDHYLSESAKQAALGFIDALERATPISLAILPPAHHATPTS